ncbi:hypothetical protein P12x_001899 [Tundrisphaera lichenicola]|uniref:hypothetical protein n=1 Tax=Tundrisphaera lichenicola TaxID=2029860 RepID=UPI003EBA0F2D
MMGKSAMKSNRSRVVLGLSLIGSSFQGCGCVHHRQVFIKERRGTPVQVDTREGVRVRAPFVDIQVPARKSTTAGEIDVPMIEPD